MGASAVQNLTVVPNVAERLLARLERVEKWGTGWRARCPAHDGKSRDSLSVAVADDGRLLIHCFAGCEALEIVQAVGLELSDLFPERITHNATPEQRRELRQSARQAQWAAALGVLEFEARIVAVAADQITRGEPLNGEDRARLGLSLERVQNARSVLCGR